MESTNLAIAKNPSNIPLSELSNYHRQIEEKFKNQNPVEFEVNPDTQALMAFNGYYALNTTGAFFAVDTNMYMTAGAEPTYILDLLVSLDGTTSTRIPFTGTFDGTKLVQENINMTFTRTDGSDGTTASCTGTITLLNQAAATVSGTTYNNLIPASLFKGDYYESRPLYTTGKKLEVQTKVMSIGDGYQVLYDNGTNSGQLQPVPSYVYNMNMYFFTFTQGTDTVSLIMGTAGSQGFACNNMTTDKSVTPNKVTTRSLLTIPGAPSLTPGMQDISSSQLAGFSGYYQIKSVAPLAFVSIQAEYVTLNGSEVYATMISVSEDGVKSDGCYFDPATMTFENNTLTLTLAGKAMSFIFNREYNATQGSLVSLTGKIGDKNITGNTLFNPVPLSVFGGAALTNDNGDTLTITNNNEVVYNGTTMNNFIYVPLMYILANPAINTTTVMSLGTAGLQGNACILTDVTTGATTFLYALPNANN